ncbi:hypothetical protein Tco_1448131 [Tanacetum coccineum]
MSSNSDDIQAAGSDTRPPMLDRTDYESWSQRIRLYCRGKENGLQILQSIDQGPFELGTTRDALGTTPEGGVLLGPERPRTYEDLSDTEKKRYDADVRATNIVLQGLPKDIYKLINHNIEAKAIWDNVKMLLAGSELTKEDRESQLYDEFERFKMLPGENINEYYVRFHKLVNDMRNIRMTMPNIQLNSKFVNNMSPEWDRFVTAVKLNKGLKETNHEQLYAYLKQHEKHAAQDRLIIERITPATNDQLAFVSTVQPHAQSSHVQSHQYPSSSTNPQSPQYPQFPETSQIDSGYTQTDELLDNLTKQMALLAQSFRATLPQTNNQLRTSSNTQNQATIQDGRVVNRAGNANAGQGKPVKCYNYNGVRHIARNCTQPKRPQNSDYFKDKMLLMQAQENDVDNQPVQDLALNEDKIFQEDECDAFDSDVDDEPTAQSIFMANLSSVGSANPQAGPSNASILSECPLPTIQWKAHGRLLPLGRHALYLGLTALKSYCSPHLIHMKPSLRSETMYNRSHGLFDRKRHFGAIMEMGNMSMILKVCRSESTHAFVRDLMGVDLIKGSRGNELNTNFGRRYDESSPYCLLSKALQEQNPGYGIRRLNHLNLTLHGALARKELVKKLWLLPVTPKTDPLYILFTTKPHMNRRLDEYGDRVKNKAQLVAEKDIVKRRNKLRREWLSVFNFRGTKSQLADKFTKAQPSRMILIHSPKRLGMKSMSERHIKHLQMIRMKHKFHPRLESPLHLPTEEPILGYLKFSAKGTKREVFGIPILNELITDDIRGADYYNAYLKKVAKHHRYLAGKEVSDPDSPIKETTEATPPAKRTKAGKVAKKRTLKRSHQLVEEVVDEGILLTEPGFGDLEADTQRAIEESLKDVHGTHRGPFLLVVFRELDTGISLLSKIEGKERRKSGSRAKLPRVLLNLQTPKKKSPTEQYIFQRRTSAPTEPSGHDESSFLYAELGLTESDTESDEEVPPISKSGAPDEGQAGPNPGIQDEG